MLTKDLDSAWWALRLSLGLAAFLAGLDKFFNLLTNWSMYVSPPAASLIPGGADTLMRLVGPVEMLVGLAILTRWTRIGAWAASAWLLAIAINLAATGSFLDVAVRDVVMSIAAAVLGRLTAVRELSAAGQFEAALSGGASRGFAHPLESVK